MKKTFLLFAVMLTIGAQAQDLGKIIIRNSQNTLPKFIASLNGIRLSNDYHSDATFINLEENMYRLKLLHAGSTKVITFNLSSEPKYLSKYIITKDNMGNYNVILENKSLIMDEPNAPSTPVVSSEAPKAVEPAVVSTPKRHHPVPSSVAAPQTNISGEAKPVESTPVAITNISTQEFNERLAAVKKTSFDDKRLAKAKQVFDGQYFSTDQVIQVVKAFSFDDSKLGFAKWAYNHTIDKDHYYKVADHFSFSSTKVKLNNYVQSQPK